MATEQEEFASLMAQDSVDGCIARAVISAPLPDLPHDFPAQVASYCNSRRQADWMERLVSTVLLALLGVTGAMLASEVVIRALVSMARGNLPLILTLATTALLVMKTRNSSTGFILR